MTAVDVLEEARDRLRGERAVKAGAGQGLAADPVDVALEGDFNPAIFAPLWFVTHGLLPDGADASATGVVVTGMVTSFQAGRVYVQVTRESMLIRVEGDDAETAGELAAGVLGRVPHTPISRLEIIRHWHLPGAPVWEAVVPLDRWDDLAEAASVVELTVSLPRRNPQDPDTVCSVEPSDVDGAGLHLVAADRFDLDAGASQEAASRLPARPLGAASAMKVLAEQWAASGRRGSAAGERMLQGLMPGVKVKAG